MRVFWPATEAAQVDYETLRAAVVGRCPTHRHHRRALRPGRAGGAHRPPARHARLWDREWLRAQLVAVAVLAGARRPAWTPQHDPRLDGGTQGAAHKALIDPRSRGVRVTEPMRRPVIRRRRAQVPFDRRHPVIDGGRHQWCPGRTPHEVHEDVPVLEAARAASATIKRSSGLIDAGVAQLPHVVAVEPLQHVGDVQSARLLVLHAETGRMVLARHNVDEGHAATAQMPVAMLQRQTLAEPHPGLGQRFEQQPIPHRAGPLVAVTSAAVVEDRRDLIRCEHRHPMRCPPHPHHRPAVFPVTVEMTENTSTGSVEPAGRA